MNQHSSHKSPRRVALYARYSTDMQNPMSIEDQFRQATRYANQRGWAIVERFSDSAISGTSSRTRPDFARLSEALHDNAFDIVLTESLDRLSRDQEHLAGFYKAARYANVEIHTIGRGKVDAMTLGLSSMMSAMFLEDLSDKVRRGIEGKVMSGRSGGGRIYGYRPGTDARGAPDKGALAIDDLEAAVVRRIFRDYAAGMSPIAIASALNDDGIPSPSVGTKRASSGHWKQNTINGNRTRGTGILNNELYIGRRIWNRLCYRKDPLTEKKRSTLNPESEWQIVEVPQLRIVDQELWDAVKTRQESQAKRRSKMSSTDRNHLSVGQSLRRRKYLLSGLLHCGLCGGKMTVAGSGKYKAYYCANAKEKGKSVCAGFRGLKETRASEMVLSALRSELMQPEAYEAFQTSFKKHLAQSQGSAEDTLRLHDARVRELETSHRNLLRAIETGDAVAVLLPRLNAVDAELKAMKLKREEIVPSAVELPDNLPELYRAMVTDLAASLSDEAVAGRAADELHEIVDHVVVHWDADADGHRLELSGNLLEMLRKSAPSELDAVRGDIFAEVGCGSRI
ncbi:recombinase family protein [Salipiger bermudensis]|uniref:Resolvase n=1 Tax=Salipiger bermudensis (strain DSM 26914 / JCM 13377 / KCTC 12554 / HTCC2601) TaxID=314265 RepID=Q0FKL1_SALBH|nr:recombinase family protein [Salipiger bermudensis]EAU44721.1 resolvase [Salipiger bermudensis HTCC2601]